MTLQWYLHRIFGHKWVAWTGTSAKGYTCVCGVKKDAA